MTRFRSKHYMDGLLILLLFGVFAVSILAVLLSGAGAYRRLTERDDRAYDRRTAVQYVATKVRQSAGSGGVSVAPFEDVEALELREEIEGDVYITRIYCSEGYLRELYTSEDAEMLPEDGEQVLPAQMADFCLAEDLLTVRLVDAHGEETELTLSLRGEGGAAA